ncbi:MAG: DUF2282 domain-containing protein [Oligoflexales bacterium]
MNKTLIIAAAAAAGIVSLQSASAKPKKGPWKPCYGVAAKGMNDCGANGHDCAGYAKVDNDPSEWVKMPASVCKKLAKGSLKKPEKK